MNKVKDDSYVQTIFGAETPKETSPKDYEFTPCDLPMVRSFIESHHYSRSADVGAIYCFAMVSNRTGVVAAAIFGKPAMNSIYKLYADKEPDVIELRRLVGADDTPKNTESFFIGKCLKWLIKNTDKKTVVSYADPSFGHKGGIYRATNFIYDGKAGNTVVLQLPLSECVHEGECLAEGKPFCQVHDRNLRCKTKDGLDYTPQAKKLRNLLETGKAELVKRETKHRYHYHLEEKRTDKKQDCRICKELPTINIHVKSDTVKLVETSTDYIPKGYILGE